MFSPGCSSRNTCSNEWEQSDAISTVEQQQNRMSVPAPRPACRRTPNADHLS